MADFASIRFQPSRPLLRELSADRLNSILTEIKRNKPKGERGITVRQDGTGTYIGLAASIKGGTSVLASSQPWDLKSRQDPENENQYIVTVRPGLLSGFLPTNWADEFICASSGIYYAKAIVQTDSTAITGVTIQINTSPPAQQEPQVFSIATQVDYLFGLFAEGQAYRVIAPGQISLSPTIWLTKQTETPAAAGELPWAQYYQLQ